MSTEATPSLNKKKVFLFLGDEEEEQFCPEEEEVKGIDDRQEQSQDTNAPGNLDITSDLNQSAYTQQLAPEDQVETADENLNENDMLEKILSQSLERQENIIYNIGNDTQLPLIDNNVNTFQDLCLELNSQLGFLFDYYEDLRKNQSSKFHVNPTQAQRQLIREKENLNTLLKQQTDENKDLQVKIKQYNDEIQELLKKMNYFNSTNTSGSEDLKVPKNPSTKHHVGGPQRLTPKNGVKQIINLDAIPDNTYVHLQASQINEMEELHKELKLKEEKLREQFETISQLEKNLQDLKGQQKEKYDQRSQLLTAQSLNIQNKYQQHSLSNIDESDHESSFNKQDFISRRIEERDLLISNLQEKIKILVGNSSLQLNIFSNDSFLQVVSSPKRKIFSRHSSASNLISSPSDLVFRDFNLFDGGHKDLIQQGVNQAQIIEKFLKKEIKNEQQENLINNEQKQLISRIDEMNKDYTDLLKQFKALFKEKAQMQKAMDDLTNKNKIIKNDLKIQSKQVSQQIHLCQQQLLSIEENKFQTLLQSEHPDVDDLDSLLEYIATLLEDKQYDSANKIWKNLDYQDLNINPSQNIEYLRILLKFKDQQLINTSKHNSPDNKKINEIVAQHHKYKNEKIDELERQLEDLQTKNGELEDQVSQLQRKVELTESEKAHQKKKNDIMKKKTEDAVNELQMYKEKVEVDQSERHEFEVGKLKQEIRILIREKKSLQAKQKQSAEYLVDDHDNYYSFKPPCFEYPQSKSPTSILIDGIKHSRKHSTNSQQQKLQNQENSLGPFLTENVENLLKKFQSQFFSNEYKSSQDKILNKNSVFKELLQFSINEIQAIKEKYSSLKKKYQQEHSEIKQLKGLQEANQTAHQYAIKLVKRLQKDNQSDFLKDIQELKLIQVLKIVSQLLKDYDSQKEKMAKFKAMMSFQGQESERKMSQLTKEEALALLRELSNENDQLSERAVYLTSQWQDIALQVKQLQKTNEQFEKENQRLVKAAKNNNMIKYNDSKPPSEGEIEPIAKKVPQFRTLDPRETRDSENHLAEQNIKNMKSLQTAVKQDKGERENNTFIDRQQMYAIKNGLKKPPREPNIINYYNNQPSPKKAYTAQSKLSLFYQNQVLLKPRATNNGNSTKFKFSNDLGNLSNLKKTNHNSYYDGQQPPTNLTSQVMSPATDQLVLQYDNLRSDSKRSNYLSMTTQHRSNSEYAFQPNTTTVNEEAEQSQKLQQAPQRRKKIVVALRHPVQLLSSSTQMEKNRENY